MLKTHTKKITAFMSVVTMLFSMLLYFPSGIFSNIDFGLKASAVDMTQPSGDGSSDSPYQIGTAAELYWFADKVNNDNATYGSANAVLTADITVNKGDVENAVANCNGNKTADWIDWTPIGLWNNDKFLEVYHSYTGTFDGQNHTVSGLYFNDTTNAGSQVGLFGSVENGSVSNVGVVDSYFKGNTSVGGVCGQNYGEITNCYNTGTVSGSTGVGGVCGENITNGNTATIINCYNTGTVNGESHVGGVCGCNNFDATITNCYNTGAVNGTEKVGGVCGKNFGYSGETATISNCYNTGTVSGSNDVGGVCGENYASGGTAEITNCYYNNVKYTGEGVGVNTNGTVGDNVSGKTTEEFSNGTVCRLVTYHSVQNCFCALCGANLHVPNYAVRSNVIQPTCTSSGSYTRTTYCKICGQAYKVEKVTTDPIDHDYSSGGICKVCGALKNGRDGFKSASLTLTDGVILNYYLLLSDEALADKNAYIHFTSPQGLDKKIMLSDGVETDDRYMFSLELRPDQMSDEITAQVVYSDSTVGSSINYSVQKYTESVDSASSIKALADAMLKFGAFSQLYTGNNTGNLPADVTDYTVNASIGDEYKHQLTSNISGISVKGATLEIGAYTTIRVKYQLAQGESISKYTFKCGDTVLTPEKSGDYYYVYLKNIRPQNLDEMYSFTVTDGKNTTTLKYSAFSYMKNILDNPGSYNKNIVNLMNAMYDYNKAADTYIGGN